MQIEHSQKVKLFKISFQSFCQRYITTSYFGIFINEFDARHFHPSLIRNFSRENPLHCSSQKKSELQLQQQQWHQKVCRALHHLTFMAALTKSAVNFPATLISKILSQANLYSLDKASWRKNSFIFNIAIFPKNSLSQTKIHKRRWWKLSLFV